MKKFEIVIWETYSSNILEDKKLLLYKDIEMKLKHEIILWGSWWWKSYSQIFNIGSKLFYSSYYSKNSNFIVLDTHNWLKNWIIEVYKNFKKIYIEENMKIWITEEKIVNIINYWKIYDWLYDKELISNPIFIKELNNKSWKEFEKILFLHLETVLSSLKWYFKREEFWARNQNLLKITLLFLILLNHTRYIEYNELHKKSKTNLLNPEEKDKEMNLSFMYTLNHIPDFLDTLLKEKDFSKEFNFWLKNLLNHDNQYIKFFWEKILKWKDYIVKILKSNTEFIESSINKLSMLNSLSKEFWYMIPFTEYTLNFSELFTINSTTTNYINFSLGDYNIIQKKILSSFIYTYSYFFWLEKDHNNKELNEHFIYWEEFNSLVNSDVLTELIWACTSELRKKKISYIFFFQDLLSQKWVNEIYENIWMIYSYWVSFKQSEFIIKDIKSWLTWDMKNMIDNNDLINLDIWECFVLMKFTQGWNISLKIQSINYKNENIYQYIFNKLNHEK